MIYGPIESSSWWGDEVTPKQFKKDLDDCGTIETLNIYINSPGGDVFAAQAIHSIIKRKKCKVNTYIDGLAASGASIIAMAGDNIIMPSNAMMMIHEAWTYAWGNAADLRKTADDLEKITESVVAVYVEKTGQSEEKVKKMLAVETWLTAKDAFEMGFCTEIQEEKQVAASLKSGVFYFNEVEMDLSKFKNAPKLVLFETKIDEEKQKEPEEAITIDLQLQILNLKKKKYNFLGGKQ